MFNTNDQIDVNTIILVSKDGHRFYLPTKVAVKSPKFKSDLNIFKQENVNESKLFIPVNYSKEIVNIISDYLNHKYYFEEISKEIKTVEFNFPEEYSLQVLICSKELGL